jgi:hypothetical protein
MPTTMKLIGKTVLSTSAATVDFQSIPATMTDLLIAISARGSAAATERNVALTFNGSATSQSSRVLEGNGTTVSSVTLTWLYGGVFAAATSTANTFGNIEIYIPNYAGSSNKSFSVSSVSENNATKGLIDLAAGLWSNTAAINQITFSTDGGNYVAGSSFFLYGITKA